jgi:multidrug efflux pump subunit AcrA (membrane-fusion protein)
LVIPHEALVDEDGRMVVFVQLDGETFEKRHVTIGGDDGLNAVVRNGLLQGERIVVNSPYSILLAQAGTSVPAHGHAH